ncbi:hypothetical protein HHX47_DHR2001074 [Lentinula edodes]|nr:hypothetical protein HHX47_DHR2001074 [Lentinula edodes]
MLLTPMYQGNLSSRACGVAKRFACTTHISCGQRQEVQSYLAKTLCFRTSLLTWCLDLGSQYKTKLASLALKLVPQHPTRWADWILHCVTSLSGNGASAEYILDFLSIVAEEVDTADLMGPTVITLLNPEFDTTFVAASDTLQEIMSKSPLSDGSGTRILTEPLLLWLNLVGTNIVDSAVQSGYTDDVSYSLCKLLAALGDHSASHLAANIASTASVTLLPSSIPAGVSPADLNKTKGQLCQTFLRLLLAYTGFPGFYGADEDVSEMTLGFWYILQEALWNNDFYFPDGGETQAFQQSEMGDQSGVAKALYVQLVQVLKRKITWPSSGHNWSKGAYASWFAVSSRNTPSKTELLMSTISFIVQALPDQMLSLQAASALRNICDANRTALAPQIGAFAELHAGLAQIPDSEKSKVMESIASVVQALPPLDAIPTIEAQPSLTFMRKASAGARDICVLQLETLTGIAKGLTRISAFGDGLSDEEPGDDKEIQSIEAARQDPRMVQLRESILNAVRGCVDIFRDAEIAQELNDLVKSITSLPSDATLVTLPAPPLLEIVCFALQRQPTASWLTLAGILINQLSPPPPMPIRGKNSEKEEQRAKAQRESEEQAKVVVAGVLPLLLNSSLLVFAAPGGMENVAQDFTGNFYTLPPGALGALMQSDEQWQSTFIHRSYVHATLASYREEFIATYGRAIMQAILSGLAGQAPRSVTQNLIEMLSTMLTRCLEESQVWLKEVLFDVGSEIHYRNFTSSKATLEDKERFMKSITGVPGCTIDDGAAAGSLAPFVDSTSATKDNNDLSEPYLLLVVSVLGSPWFGLVLTTIFSTIIYFMATISLDSMDIDQTMQPSSFPTSLSTTACLPFEIVRFKGQDFRVCRPVEPQPEDALVLPERYEQEEEIFYVRYHDLNGLKRNALVQIAKDCGLSSHQNMNILREKITEFSKDMVQWKTLLAGARRAHRGVRSGKIVKNESSNQDKNSPTLQIKKAKEKLSMLRRNALMGVAANTSSSQILVAQRSKDMRTLEQKTQLLKLVCKEILRHSSLYSA